MNDKDFMRFITKVKIGDGCWEWAGYISELGYGKFSINGKSRGAHRASYRLFVGDIPKKLEICHRCNNRKCVRPSHLYAGTHVQNIQDSKNTPRPFGENSGKSIFTDGDIVDIRRIYRAINPGIKEIYKTDKLIAKMYNCSYHTIRKIVNRNTWKHIAEE